VNVFFVIGTNSGRAADAVDTPTTLIANTVARAMRTGLYFVFGLDLI
jgi:hypothetical protein